MVGVRVFTAARHTERVWAAAHDLAAGETVTSADLRVAEVSLPGSLSTYLPASRVPDPATVNRPVHAGELVPRSALGVSPARTTITIAFPGDNAPRIHTGDRITVWVSNAKCPVAVVLPDVVVQQVQAAGSGAFSGGSGIAVVVRVEPTEAERVVRAQAMDGAVLRAGVLTGTAPATPASGLTASGVPSSGAPSGAPSGAAPTNAAASPSATSGDGCGAESP